MGDLDRLALVELIVYVAMALTRRASLFFFQAEDGIRDVAVTGVQTFAFFFQAEDGIRDVAVTGVQTCALPISSSQPALRFQHDDLGRLRQRRFADDERVGVQTAERKPLQERIEDIVAVAVVQDRKSTRLNSSHGYISYAVFCLKKKKTYIKRQS